PARAASAGPALACKLACLRLLSGSCRGRSSGLVHQPMVRADLLIGVASKDLGAGVPGFVSVVFDDHSRSVFLDELQPSSKYVHLDEVWSSDGDPQFVHRDARDSDAVALTTFRNQGPHEAGWMTIEGDAA